MKLKYEDVKLTDCCDWDNLIQEVYSRPYCLQQQNGGQERGIIRLTVPNNNWYKYTDKVTEDAGTKEMGVSLYRWLMRDPTKPLSGRSGDKQWKIDMWYDCHFYPHVQELANDLHKIGCLDAGNYIIHINW